MGNYKFKINGKDYDVCVSSINGTNADVTVNGAHYNVEIPSDAAPVASSPSPAPEAPVSAPAPASAPSKSTIKSPLPGVIIEVCVKEGQAVKRGQKLVVLEAMKMENEIQAESDGTISAIHVSKGDSVLEGADIVSLS